MIMNYINATSLLPKYSPNIIRLADTAENKDKSRAQLQSVAKAFSQISITFFQNDRKRCDQLFISIINKSFCSDQQKIDAITLLIKRGFVFTQELILQCKELYGLSPKLDALLRNNVSLTDDMVISEVDDVMNVVDEVMKDVNDIMESDDD